MQGEVVLQHKSGQPHVVRRNRRAVFAELAEDRRVVVSRLVVGEDDAHAVLQQKPPEYALVLGLPTAVCEARPPRPPCRPSRSSRYLQGLAVCAGYRSCRSPPPTHRPLLRSGSFRPHAHVRAKHCRPPPERREWCIACNYYRQCRHTQQAPRAGGSAVLGSRGLPSRPPISNAPRRWRRPSHRMANACRTLALRGAGLLAPGSRRQRHDWWAC